MPALFCLCLSLPAADDKGQNNILKFNAESNIKLKFNIEPDKRAVIKSLCVRNSGLKKIGNLRLSFNDDVDLSNIASIAEGLKLNDKNNKDKVVALFDLFNRYTTSVETFKSLPKEERDPIKLLNIYGTANSLDICHGFAFLCGTQNFKTKIWNVKSNYAIEVLYDEKWHYFDPAKRIFFENKDGEALGVYDILDLASTSTLMQKRNIKLNINSPAFPQAKLIKDNISNQVYPYGNYTDHDCGFALNRGDSIVFKPLVVDYDLAKIDSMYIVEPDISQKSFIESLTRNENITCKEEDKSKGANLRIAEGAMSGLAEFKIDFPYPIESAQIQIASLIKKNSSIKFSVSKDGSLWSEAATLDSKSGEEQNIDIKSAMLGSYSYFIRIEITQEKARQAGIDSLKIVNNFKYNKMAFPKLKPGENYINVDLGGKYAVKNKLDIELEIGNN